MKSDISASKIIIWAGVAAANHKLPQYALNILPALPQLLTNEEDIANIEFIILYGLNRKEEAMEKIAPFIEFETSKFLPNLAHRSTQ